MANNSEVYGKGFSILSKLNRTEPINPDENTRDVEDERQPLYQDRHGKKPGQDILTGGKRIIRVD